MIEVSRRRIVVNGRPRILMAGEIHYFRVSRDQWQDRIDKALEVGCTAIASYIPWLWHELPDGSIDVTGATRPERDIAAFIDLCRDAGLYFIARPGPFIMAELKNEGLPYRLYTDHPEIVSTGWAGKVAPTRTVDYLAPAYLQECRRWFDAVLPPIAARLEPRGGNVIGVQLDNEIGMLAWVSNSPDLTDHLLADLARWCRSRHGNGLSERYRVDLDDPAAWREAVESPSEQWAAALRVDLGLFMRDRFARYVQALTTMAQANGIDGVPLLINIHGTEGGNGVPFAIGVSQLLETFAGVPGMVAGSDHYLGDMSMETTADLHFINACQAAVNSADQPLTSLEFEAGTGDYGGGLERLYDPSTVDLKTRLFLAQGNRLINYYLLAGGINPPLEEPVGDGNDRISFTGQRHGTAAPIGPEGQRGLTFAGTARVCRAASVHERLLADMDEELDDLALAFLPDAFMTEYVHPESTVMNGVRADLEQFRGPGPRKSLWRSLLLGGYRFGAVNLQDGTASLPSLVALSSGRHLAAEAQERLVGHLRAGGRLLLLGLLPECDLEDRPCTILAEALGLTPGPHISGSHRYYPSVRGLGWADTVPETRVGWLQELHGGSPLLRDVDGRVCAVEASVHGGPRTSGHASDGLTGDGSGEDGDGDGAGRAIVLAAELPAMPALFASFAARLGVRPGLSMRTDLQGVVATTTRSPGGERLLHVLNPSGYAATVELELDGRPLCPDPTGQGPLLVPARSGHMLALGVDAPWGRIVFANAELTYLADDGFTVGTGLGGRTVVVLQSAAAPAVTGGSVTAVDGGWMASGDGPLHIAPPG